MSQESVHTQDLALRFFEAWESHDLEKVMSFMAPDAVYHNVPVEPVHGAAAIREVFGGFLSVFASMRFEILYIATSGPVALTERIDDFRMRSGQRIMLPVMGVLQFKDRLIVRFSDYFDLGDFERQSGIRL